MNPRKGGEAGVSAQTREKMKEALAAEKAPRARWLAWGNRFSATRTGSLFPSFRRRTSIFAEVQEFPLVPEEPKKTPRFRVRGYGDLRGPRKVSLRPFLRKGEIPHCPYHIPDATEISLSREKTDEREEARYQAIGDTKVERNLRFVRPIEEIWRSVGEMRRNFVLKGSVAGIGTMEYRDDKKVSGDIIREREGGYPPVFLSEKQRQITDTALLRWVNESEGLTFNRLPYGPLTEEASNYQRLKELVGLMNAFRYEELFHPRHPHSLLQLGLNNTIFIAWGLYGVSPEAFEDKYNRKPIKRELASMYASSEHIATSLGIGLLQLGVPFRDSIIKHNSADKIIFNREDFTVKEVPDPENEGETLPVLVIRDEAFKKFEIAFEERLQHPDPKKPLNRLDEDATGCPAVYARGIGPVTAGENEVQARVKDVIAEGCQWTYLIATHLSADYLKAPDTIEEITGARNAAVSKRGQ
jgi:hypothetical protein